MVGEGPLNAGAARTASRLWGITSYFNPMRYRRRLANYRTFRARLDVPLVAVELACEGGFELAEGDAEILIQLRGRDVMWQKERLLNLALAALPNRCSKVVWIDCDVIFAASDWWQCLDALLDRHAVVQAFRRAYHVAADWCPAAAPTASPLFAQLGALALVADEGTEALASRIPSGPGSSNKGIAWAAQRALIAQNGLYDACIVGGGDLAFVAALCGRFDIATRVMNERQSEHYLRWARRWHAAAANSSLGVLDAEVLHLWHGDVGDRRYRERHDGLRPHDFDPATDIALDERGAWRWNTDKPAMHEYVRDYFAARREDG